MRINLKHIAAAAVLPAALAAGILMSACGGSGGGSQAQAQAAAPSLTWTCSVGHTQGVPYGIGGGYYDKATVIYFTGYNNSNRAVTVNTVSVTYSDGWLSPAKSMDITIPAHGSSGEYHYQPTNPNGVDATSCNISVWN